MNYAFVVLNRAISIGFISGTIRAQLLGDDVGHMLAAIGATLAAVFWLLADEQTKSLGGDEA